MVVSGYNKWLDAHLEETEAMWANMDRGQLLAAIEKHDPATVIEFCCGTGWIPKGLNEATQYMGIDANAGCIAYAKRKNPEPTRMFAHLDVITMPQPEEHDLALAFSCLKHFTLADWDQVYGMILRSGRRTLTTIFRGEEREDESPGYPHTRVSMDRVERLCEENNHRIVEIFTLPPLNKEPEPLVLTELIVAEPSASSEESEFDL